MSSRHERRAGWPTTVTGQVSAALAATFGAMFVWVMLLEPVAKVLTGRDPDGLADAWLTPLAMVAIVDAAAVTGIVARLRGERATVARVVLWASVVVGLVWTTTVVGTLLTDR